MKKTFLLFTVALISLTSCSSDDDGQNDNGNNNSGIKLPKSEVTTSEPEGTISKLDYTYDGTKIKTTSGSNTTKSVYTYNESNVLSKIEFKENDITKSSTKYVFDNGDIKSTTTYSVSADNVETKTSYIEYTYDAAAKTQTAVTTTYPAGVPTVSNTKIVNTYDDNNLVKTVTTATIDDKNDTVTTTVYVYDDKSSSMKNVTGQPATIVKGQNNPKTINTTVIVRTDNTSGTPITTQSTYDYEYDESGFPILVTSYSAGSLISVKDIFYN
ncbi:hypothetical protein ACFFU9_06295 [Mariniflexile ostreae]|uniref:YD repeat-containing protein n=1 Tax=Mariniflexile ostreae TaxID=1520892 RepID=A0ABV5FA89_9FLAO